ncbi:hypothetical protein F543_5380 [Bibersteinia trehalosi USDA-ARS-USMARC-189]|uniref:Uncharacterized protein n=1 Tax=Bibersteinia trehalosi USDA-ARS-USMARC-189 TaxID=1263831 RepID=A0ABM5PB58_BIBTR|nr:hypothetical protein WQG_17870 [Bibersteinia trehalosi USDA-ARS-USMARC-192]AHG83402.1 hypothetical protein F543_5380 [Bibersteinia trehalosi USDA-ARS-USMARC-189]
MEFYLQQGKTAHCPVGIFSLQVEHDDVGFSNIITMASMG